MNVADDNPYWAPVATAFVDDRAAENQPWWLPINMILKSFAYAVIAFQCVVLIAALVADFMKFTAPRSFPGNEAIISFGAIIGGVAAFIVGPFYLVMMFRRNRTQSSS